MRVSIKSNFHVFFSGAASGAAKDVFMGGKIGIGWAKTVYGDKKRAMYTYDPSVSAFDDGSVALCTEIQQYGKFSP